MGAWVDLWRGILLCDLLEDSPKLRDLPLPLPARGNWEKFLNGPPGYYRDNAVNQSKDTIKYVEMEITEPAWVPRAESASDFDSYDEWLRREERPLSYTPWRLVAGRPPRGACPSRSPRGRTGSGSA